MLTRPRTFREHLLFLWYCSNIRIPFVNGLYFPKVQPFIILITIVCDARKQKLAKYILPDIVLLGSMHTHAFDHNKYGL